MRLTNSQETGAAPDCVATTLLETMMKNVKDNGYMESVVSGALGSMYVGKSLRVVELLSQLTPSQLVQTL